MSKGGATTVVIVAGGLLAAMALIPAEGQTGSAYRKLWAAGLLTTGLAFAADLVPDLVGPFAVLIIIAAAVKNPGVLGGFLGTPPAKSAQPFGFSSPATATS